MRNTPQQEQLEETRLTEQSTRLDNAQLLKLVEACDQLYKDLDHGIFYLTLSKEQTAARDTLRVQVKQVKTVLEQERSKRVLRGCQQQWQHLLAELYRQQPEREIHLIIPYPVQGEPSQRPPRTWLACINAQEQWTLLVNGEVVREHVLSSDEVRCYALQEMDDHDLYVEVHTTLVYSGAHLQAVQSEAERRKAEIVKGEMLTYHGEQVAEDQPSYMSYLVGKE